MEYGASWCASGSGGTWREPARPAGRYMASMRCTPPMALLRGDGGRSPSSTRLWKQSGLRARRPHQASTRPRLAGDGGNCRRSPRVQRISGAPAAKRVRTIWRRGKGATAMPATASTARRLTRWLHTWRSGRLCVEGRAGRGPVARLCPSARYGNRLGATLLAGNASCQGSGSPDRDEIDPL